MKILTTLIAIVLSLPAWADQYTYDNLSRLTTVQYDNGARISYTYDATGNILSIIQQLSPPTSSSPTIGTATAGNASATITFSAPSFGGGSSITSYTATSSPGGFTGSCTAPCSSITVTGLTNGTAYTFTVTASNSAGSSPPSAASNRVMPGQISQTISFGGAPTLVVGGTGTVSAIGGASGNPVTFSSTTPSVCTITGSTVTSVSAGTCTIAANQAGNANYASAAQVTQNIIVGQGTQTISFGAAPTLVVGGTGTVSATGGASGNAVTFSSTTPSVCTISGSTVTGVSVGTCAIAANQAGNANYSAAPQATQNITVGKGNQRISFGVAPTVVVGGTGSVSATGGASGNAVTFSSITTGVCTISGSTVSGVGAGTCTIAANQAGNANYNTAPQVTQNITVTPFNFVPILNLLLEE